ncbi:MAG: chorismate-binding protein, partial [Leptotrichiaceae bacterium]
GKFAESGSVVVRKPMHIQYYQHVMHIVSEVYGKKRKDISLFDVISIVFPAGTLSGAPKIRAMEIIAELEEFKRHIYGGGLGFLHFNGNVQLAIIIRTGFYTSISPTKYNVYIQAGAGVVYDSIKEKEYAEITHKRQSLMNVFKTCCSNKEVK